MDIFSFRNRLVKDYADYVRSFINIGDDRIRNTVEHEIRQGLLWPDPLIQLNPSFEPGAWIDELADEGLLHEDCASIFRLGKQPPHDAGRPLRLHCHQEAAIRAARRGVNYVLTTGTGSGKSLAYIIPIVDCILREGPGRGIRAIVVYPMNALANSQYGELEKFLCAGFEEGEGPVSFARYTGQESDEERQAIQANPPDILLTNYVMLELILTRPHDHKLIEAAQDLRFLVLDELHTYRGRQGADVALLVRRVRERLSADRLQCVGTSATMSSDGPYDDRQRIVADVASQLFGARVHPENVIGETLRRSTPERNLEDPSFLDTLRLRLQEDGYEPPATYEDFIQDPLSIWIESTFGVQRDPDSGRLERATPRAITGPDGAASALSRATGVDEGQCARRLQQGLLAAYTCAPDPATGLRPFAFRLHQFISRGDTVYASLELESDRYITVRGQTFVPGDRHRVLLPLAFCRECGQPYFTVRRRAAEGGFVYAPREVGDQQDDPIEGESGFLYLNSEHPWPDDQDALLERLPDDWLEVHRGTLRVRQARRDDLPSPVFVTPTGHEDQSGLRCHYIEAPFRFCLHCGVSYGTRQRSDFAKLATLGSEGRSTATTILSLAAIRHLSAMEELPPEARKLLSFTDNRQDASLQAGHFNDFVEVSQLRGALYQAVRHAGAGGIRHDELTQRVFDALDLPLHAYAADPDVRFLALEETQQALRGVIGYRLYRDLKRGWRITAPNLEQVGLLQIEYLSLSDLCRDEATWASAHPVLAGATPEVRERVARTLLDFMRRELALKVDYLDARAQESLVQRSNQRLVGSWAFDEDEAGSLEKATILLPRSRRSGDFGGFVYLSGRGGFGQFLGRPTTFPENPTPLTVSEREDLIRSLLETLRIAGLVERVLEPRFEEDVPGYQIPAAALRWKEGDGTTPFHDPIRVPALPEEGRTVNTFFVHFYREVANTLTGIEAREHTAQVPYEQRLEREERFRRAELPVLYCSPTMELGVDIAQLNVVNMRNVPPTPANYAQRSGRAGRSGQPALVFTYCSAGSSHDQYFFRRPERMVAGVVMPPRLDLANEDLVRAHVQAIWLAETGLSLGSSLQDILQTGGDNPSLALQDYVAEHIRDEAPRRRALARARRVLDSLRDELAHSDWYTEGWLDEVMAQVARNFDAACDRWRSLYRAALRQAHAQNRIILDATRTHAEREQAKRLRREAEQQLALLTEARNLVQSDFYSYRYFASEGFLPGYSFPRLPLAAYIPARRKSQADEFLSRPRFLAISEFGPRAIIYHEGSRYIINKVILPVDEEADLMTRSAKRCEACGYLHPIVEGDGPDVCERCGAALGLPMRSLFRLQNVSTRRRDRISSDEEERQRMGYELITALRFAERDGQRLVHTGTAVGEEGDIARLSYGHTATLWRINLGWTRRQNRQQYGFVLDLERGYWARNEQAVDDPNDPLSARTARVVPYVEDRRNALVIDPVQALEAPALTTLMAALAQGIRIVYQLEDSELAAELLPGRDEPRQILFYEAAEGGAGVLRHLAGSEDALARVAREALQICHYDPDTGEDLRRAPRAREDCEAACYDCLMTYQNQRDHALLDRRLVRDLLLELSQARTLTSPADRPRAAHLAALRARAGSSLEQAWLDFLDAHGLRLPSRAQVLIPDCHTRPDFVYDEEHVAVYVNGPPHDHPDRQARDVQQTECMEDLGYTVLRFHHQDDWPRIVRAYPYIFGSFEQPS